MAKKKGKSKETVSKGMEIDGQGFVPSRGMGEAIRGGSFKVC